MDGYTLTGWLKENYPKVIILAMDIDENKNAIQKMIDNGARGFICKDVEPKEIRLAIEATLTKSFYKANSNNRFY